MKEKTKPGACVSGDGVLADKLRQNLKKKTQVYNDFPQDRKISYVFYFAKEINEDVSGLLGIALKKKAKLLYLLPQNWVSKATSEIFKHENEQGLDARIVQVPHFVFREGFFPQGKEEQYLRECVEGILAAMFEDKTRGGLFKLAEPPFLEKDSVNPTAVKKSAGSLFRFFRFKVFLLILFLSLVLPIVLTILFSALGAYQLVLSRDVFLAGEIKKAKVLARGASFSFALSQKTIHLTAGQLWWGSGDFLEAASKISRSEERFIGGATLLEGWLERLLRGENAFGDENFRKGREEIIFSQKELEGALLILKSETISPPFFKASLKKAVSEVEEYQRLLGKAVSLLEIAPQFLGEKTKKTYLVLLQNNMELRPTGGFIGSYGLISFENGKLLNFEVFDVYSADGQLKGHIEPPFPLKKYLDQQHWFLRDSNWDPDFTISGPKAAWFLEKETGEKVDGVIGMDVSLVGLVISGLSQVDLPDYQETITQDNLFERAHFYAQENFFPGSRGKVDFLATLARAIFLKATNDKNISWPLLFKKLVEGIEEKHLLFYANNLQLERTFSLNNQSGGLPFAKSEKENEVADFSLAVDANLGVNKVNYFIKRNFSMVIDISAEGKVTNTLKITYQNESTRDKYKNYLRVFTPLGAILGKIDINGEEIKEIDIEQSGDKNSFGFLVEVSPKSQQTVTVIYSLEEPFLKTKGLNIYNLKVFKQPGTGNDPLAITINYPEFLTFQKVSGLLEGRLFPANQVLNIATTLSRDREFIFEFLNR